MSNDEIVKLTIAHLKPKMVLAEDAVNKLGVVVLAKNTPLTEHAFERLSKNLVVEIAVWKNSILDEERTFIDRPVKKPIPLNPITTKKEFKKFNTEYQKGVNEFKSSLETLKKGDNVPAESIFSIVDSLISVVELKSSLFQYTYYLNDLDEFTYTHCINVSIYCNVLASWLGFSEEEVKEATIAGLLHDIGKSELKPSILEREPDLSPEEMHELMHHPIHSYEMITNLDLSEEAKIAVLTHHERIDGSGYPSGLKADEINKYAKVISICDEYHYLIAKKKICPFDVIRNFKKMQISKLDTTALIKFCDNILYTYIGSWVRLSDGRKGEVVFINNIYPHKPIISVGGTLVSLANDDTLYIKEML